MNFPLVKAVVALAPTGMLFSGSLILSLREKSLFSFLQLVGSVCLAAVALMHSCEALRLFPEMQWGMAHSVGHFLDLSSAALGLTLFPAGYLGHALTKRQP